MLLPFYLFQQMLLINLCHYLRVRDQFSLLYKTTDKVTVLYVVILIECHISIVIKAVASKATSHVMCGCGKVQKWLWMETFSSIQLKGGTCYQLLDGYTIIHTSSDMEREWFSRNLVVMLETFAVFWHFLYISYFIMLWELRVLYIMRFWVTISLIVS